MRFIRFSVHLVTAPLFVLVVAFSSLTGHAQVQITEIPSASQVLEPGADTPMGSLGSNDLGDGAVAFAFQIHDVDPLSNDTSAPEITCFLVQNLGTATSSDIVEIAILDGGGTIIAGPKDDDGIGSSAPLGCPAGAPGGSIIAWEAFFPVSEVIPDYPLPGRTFQVAVRVADTNTLLSNSQNHTILLRVILQFKESIGSPPVLTVFTNSISDSTRDYVWNGGINRYQALSFTPEPIRIGPMGSTGVVARFKICDQDANTYELRLAQLILVQGPLGSAVINDFVKFELFKITGTPEPWGEINSSHIDWGPAFNRGGVGIPLDVTAGTIPDDTCADFEIRATTAMTAMKGRNVHLRITFLTEEPPTTMIDTSVAPTLQMTNLIMIGSGVLRIPDMQITGIGSLVPIEVVGFPQPGLGRIEVQTNAIQFDPNVVHIEELEPVAPYEIEDFLVDNRAGRLHFTLLLDPAQSSSAAVGIPEPQPVAFMKLSGQGGPGQRSTLLFQTDLIEDSEGDDVTAEVLVVSGSVMLLTPGDVDLLDGIPTVRDALLLAFAILSCPEEITGLSDEQKRVADVALPRAPGDAVPTCNELTSADVAEIAEMALNFDVASATTKDHLREPFWDSLPQAVQRSLSVQAVRLRPMSHGSAMWRLQVDGQGIAAVRVEGYDLTGRRRFEAEAAGSQVQWAPLDRSGRRLANGVYLYLVIVRGVSGEVWHSTIRKMVLLR
jgi:hypothetical protein